MIPVALGKFLKVNPYAETIFDRTSRVLDEGQVRRLSEYLGGLYEKQKCVVQSR
jgi:hypothetical protein